MAGQGFVGRAGPVCIRVAGIQAPGHLHAEKRAVCLNCHARFSCSSFRRYVLRGTTRTEDRFLRYLSDLGIELEREVRRTANLGAAEDTEGLVADYVQ